MGAQGQVWIMESETVWGIGCGAWDVGHSDVGNGTRGQGDKAKRQKGIEIQSEQPGSNQRPVDFRKEFALGHCATVRHSVHRVNSGSPKLGITGHFGHELRQ